jgi:hypothetical protein
VSREEEEVVVVVTFCAALLSAASSITISELATCFFYEGGGEGRGRGVRKMTMAEEEGSESNSPRSETMKEFVGKEQKASVSQLPFLTWASLMITWKVRGVMKNGEQLTLDCLETRERLLGQYLAVEGNDIF